MSDPQRNDQSGGGAHQPSRLQRRAPSSLQISRAVDWNVAIPLLSPLASSPPPPRTEDPKPQEPAQCQPEKVAVAFKKWQHPAAPFFYDPAPIVPSFVPV